MLSPTMTVVVLAYLWLDRWEPEPPRLLILAFLWGSSVAVVIASILQLVTEAAINPGAGDDVSPVTIVLGAPLTEEAAKGLFLLLMMFIVCIYSLLRDPPLQQRVDPLVSRQ